MSDRLVAWVRAQLDATEERARLALEAVSGKWDWELIAQQLHACCDTVPNIGRTGQHLHHNADPAAALADVEAKRALLEQFRLRGDSVRSVVQPSTGGVWDDLIRMLAEGFRHRPGYAEAMRDE